MISWTTVDIEEPLLRFGFGQTAEHPKDGLLLFGPPPSNQNPARMDVGVLGTSDGIARYSEWVRRISLPIAAPESGRVENKTMWPGFEAAFGVGWPSKPLASCQVDGDRLRRAIRNDNRHEAIFSAVDLYAAALRRHLTQEEARPQFWFVVIPEEIYTWGRPKSVVPRAEREPSTSRLKRAAAKSILTKGTLFQEEVEAASIYRWELNFHNQLKARLLDTAQVLQLVRDTTLAPELLANGVRRSLQDPASVAWNLSTTSFYKAGGRPWSLVNVREGVCYVGLVFKLIDDARGRDNACCGAQMFLASGEGLVFKGAVGPWYSETNKSFHLDTSSAAELMRLVVQGYTSMHDRPPSELFIHGTSWFDRAEWDGFASAVPSGTKLAGVRIRRSRDLKLFRKGKLPVLRNTAVITSPKSAYLWTVGFTPRLNTYPGREVPNPLSVDILEGEADLIQVLQDVTALTKLNFNNASYGDGLPVTLRFADLVGEVLTAGPLSGVPLLPFRYYI